MSFLFIKDMDNDNPKPYDKLEQCQADYTDQCSSDMPYICSKGLLKGSCSVDANIWQNSRMCNRFCDVRRKPNTRIIQPKSMFVGIRPPQIVSNILQVPYILDQSKQWQCPKSTPKICDQYAPFRCLLGIPVGGCASNSQTWQNDFSCKSFRDVRGHDKFMY